MLRYARWTGASGRTWTFEVHDEREATIQPYASVYVLARTMEGDQGAVYVGHASDLREHLARHPKRRAAADEGAKYVHVLPGMHDRKERAAVVRDIAARHRPPCNARGPRRKSSRRTSHARSPPCRGSRTKPAGKPSAGGCGPCRVRIKCGCARQPPRWTGTEAAQKRR